METLKKYWGLIVIGILLLVIFFMGYFFGQTLSKLKDLKREKEEYLQVKHEQDSIIAEANNRIYILNDSIDFLISDGIKIDSNSNRYKTDEKNYKEVLKKKQQSIRNLSIDEQLKLFSRESDEYEPVR